MKKSILGYNGGLGPVSYRSEGSGSGLIRFLLLLALSLAAVFLIRSFVVQPFFVRGDSMEPNFSNGEYLLVDEISYRFHDPNRGDVIVFRFPGDPSQFYIKRIVGLPGETIRIADGKVYVSDESGQERPLDENYLSRISTPGQITATIKEGEYFVLGDNRRESSDSRNWGILSERHIIGRAWIRAWPPDKAQAFSY